MKVQIKFILIASLLATIKVFAQQLSKDGERNLKYFTQCIDYLKQAKPGTYTYGQKLDQASNYITKIKQSDPSYNASDLEKQLIVYQDAETEKKKKDENDLSGTQSSRQKEYAARKRIESFLFWKPKPIQQCKTSSDFSELSKSVDEKISQIKNFCKDSLNGLNSSDRNSLLHTIESNLEQSSSDPTTLGSIQKFHATSESVESGKYSYYEVKWILAKWKTLSESFPESNDVKDFASKAEDVAKLIGSAEQGEKDAIDAKSKRVADTKMDPAVASDPQLEAQIKAAILKSKFGNGKTVVKVNLHSTSWGVQKHAVTGVVLSRTKGFSAGLKGSDGKCYLLHYVDYKQDYAGGSYGSGYLNLGEVVEIACENIK